MIPKTLWIALMALLPAAGAAQKLDLSTPEKAVRAFTAEINAGNLSGAAAAVQGSSSKSVSAEFEREWRALVGGVKFALQDVLVQTGGSSASVSFELKYINPANGKSTAAPDRLHLRKERNDWKIRPGAADSLSSGSLFTLSFVAMALADPEAWPKARTAAESLLCMKNMRQVAEAALMFRRDNQGRFPAKAGDFRSSVARYLKPSDIPRCPQDKSSGESYQMNPRILGKRFNEIPIPEDTVMIFEGKAGRILFRHDRRAVVGFADGSVRIVNEAQSRTLRWIP